MKVEEEVSMIFCGVNNLMRELPLNKVGEFEKNYIAILNSSHSDVLTKIKQGQFDDEITTVLRNVAAEVCNTMNKQ